MLDSEQNQSGDPDATLADARVALRGVLDPEIGINIVDLGLVRNVEQIQEGLRVELIMTTPACPMGEHIVHEAELALRNAFPSLRHVNVTLNPEIAWGPELMSDAAREQLGLS